jgi:hypothetical protein
MNFFERKAQYKSGSGQNPLPTPEQMDQHLAKFSIGIDWGKDVIEGVDFRRGQIKLATKMILPKLKDSEVHELYNLLMKFAIRIREEEK